MCRILAGHARRAPLADRASVWPGEPGTGRRARAGGPAAGFRRARPRAAVRGRRSRRAGAAGLSGDDARGPPPRDRAAGHGRDRAGLRGGRPAVLRDAPALDLDYQLTDRRPSPRVREQFDAARATRREEPDGGLVVGVAAPVLEGATAAASARPTGENAIARVQFTATVRGDEVPVRPVAGGPPWRADIVLPRRASATDSGGLRPGVRAFGGAVRRVPASRIIDDESGQGVATGSRRHRIAAARACGERPEPGRPWLWAGLWGGSPVAVTLVVVLVATSSGGGDHSDVPAGAGERISPPRYGSGIQVAAVSDARRRDEE